MYVCIMYVGVMKLIYNWKKTFRGIFVLCFALLLLPLFLTLPLPLLIIIIIIMQCSLTSG